MNRNNKSTIGIFVVAVILILAFGIIMVVGMTKGSKSATSENVVDSQNVGQEIIKSGKTLEELVSKVTYTEAGLVKGKVDLGNSSSLYDELPEIDKYPLAVDGNGQVDIEIFSSGEKAGDKTDGWLIDVAKNFNRSGSTTSDGKSISLSVRSVPSGTSADYIISGKYRPDLWTPSNQLFGLYAEANGADVTLTKERLVGNTAGFLIRKDSKYNSIDAIIDVVIAGEYNVGYTNPQTSAAGLNLLIQLLKDFGKGNVSSPEGAEMFAKFNNNIPYVAYTTQQMVVGAQSGSLDGMVSEYQAYINNTSLVDGYNFIPYGQRHDNPLYAIEYNDMTGGEKEAVTIITDYLLSNDSQKIATSYGFNANEDYKSSFEATGSEVVQALNIYKKNKDAGHEIIAVFVADCSGSMDGEPMYQLKQSLSNGMQYINEGNYVGLVSYSNDITISVPIAQFDLTQKSYFKGAVDGLQAIGGTSTYEALCVGMKMIEDERVNHPDAKVMLFLLSDGKANGDFSLKDISYAVQESMIPIYTIGYGDSTDADSLKQISEVNEAVFISADPEDVIYKIKSLFNSQL